MPHVPLGDARRATRGRSGAGAALAAGALATIFACSDGRPMDRPVVVPVAVASSLQDVFGALEREFERLHPGTDVRATFLSSGAAHRQLLAGAPYQALIAADTLGAAALERAGRTEPGTREVYARGILALWLAERVPTELTGLPALNDPRVERVAIANPEVAPYGRAAMDVLSHFDASGAHRRTLVRGEDAAQAAQMAVAGADAALLPLSLARSPAMQRAGRVFPVPHSLHAPVEHAAVAVTGAAEPARAFVDFLASPAARDILGAHGFRAP